MVSIIVLLLILSTNTKIIAWNCQGAIGHLFQLVVNHMNQVHHPDFLIVVEPRLSGGKAQAVIKKLGYLCSYRIELLKSMGFRGRGVFGSFGKIVRLKLQLF